MSKFKEWWSNLSPHAKMYVGGGGVLAVVVLMFMRRHGAAGAAGASASSGVPTSDSADAYGPVTGSPMGGYAGSPASGAYAPVGASGDPLGPAFAPSPLAADPGAGPSSFLSPYYDAGPLPVSTMYSDSGYGLGSNGSTGYGGSGVGFNDNYGASSAFNAMPTYGADTSPQSGYSGVVAPGIAANLDAGPAPAPGNLSPLAVAMGVSPRNAPHHVAAFARAVSRQGHVPSIFHPTAGRSSHAATHAGVPHAAEHQAHGRRPTPITHLHNRIAQARKASAHGEMPASHATRREVEPSRGDAHAWARHVSNVGPRPVHVPAPGRSAAPGHHDAPRQQQQQRRQQPAPVHHNAPQPVHRAAPRRRR